MADYIYYNGELYHYGVKGMKWGVRRTREQLKQARTVAQKSVVQGHKPTPKTSSPNSVMDHVSRTGEVDVRTFYDELGLKAKDIHTTDHGNPKQHGYGQCGEHVVEYEWNSDGSIKTKTRRELTESERKENSDIL